MSERREESDSGLWLKPEYDIPDIPYDITTLSDDKLMEMFAVYTAWLNFAASKLAEAEIDELKAESNLRYTQATVLVGGWDSNAKESRVTVAKAGRDLDPQVVKAEGDLLVVKATRKMTGVLYANCERSAQLMSRELSRRGNREPMARRSDRMRP